MRKALIAVIIFTVLWALVQPSCGQESELGPPRSQVLRPAGPPA